MSQEFRYFDQARSFAESLADIKVAEPESTETVVEDGLLRIADGNTALSGMDAIKQAAAAGADADLKEHEVRTRLRELVQKKTASVDDFITAAQLQVKEV